MVGRGILRGIQGIGLSIIFLVGIVGKLMDRGNLGVSKGVWIKEQIDRTVGCTYRSAAIETKNNKFILDYN